MLRRLRPSSRPSTVRTGDAYAWTGHFNQNVTGTANVLNQLNPVGPKSLTHDARGNVTAFGTKSFTYSSENLLLTGPASTTLSYDPAMRLYQTVSGATTQRLAYDGLDRIAEYDGGNVLQRRYVHGSSIDEPLVWYEGTGTTDRRFLSSDERGSVISVTDSNGALLGLNKYDEFGMPQSTNLGAFGYTGQAWLPTVGIWYYKARVYDPELGRFLQTDPIGYEGGLNLYAYVGNDPVNWVDPMGLDGCDNPAPDGTCPPIEVVGTRYPKTICLENRSWLCGASFGPLTYAPEGYSGPGGSSGPGQPSKPKPIPPKPPAPKPSTLCTAIRGGVLAGGTPELVRLGLHAARGATVVELFAAGVAGGAGSGIILGAVGTGALIYLLDLRTHGYISRQIGARLGC